MREFIRNALKKKKKLGDLFVVFGVFLMVFSPEQSDPIISLEAIVLSLF